MRGYRSLFQRVCPAFQERPARRGSQWVDFEMSTPLSQITGAEDAFSGRSTVRRSPVCRLSRLGRGCQNLPALGLLFRHLTFSETQMVISYIRSNPVSQKLRHCCDTGLIRSLAGVLSQYQAQLS